MEKNETVFASSLEELYTRAAWEESLSGMFEPEEVIGENGLLNLLDSFTEIVRLHTGILVGIPKFHIQTEFAFGYAPEKTEEETELSVLKARLKAESCIHDPEWIREQNTAPCRFLLEALRTRPDEDTGYLMLTPVFRTAPENPVIRTLEFLRMYPDILKLRPEEAQRLILLVHLEDRKALYAALKRSLRSLENELDALLSSSGQSGFRYVLYPEAPEPDPAGSSEARLRIHAEREEEEDPYDDLYDF